MFDKSPYLGEIKNWIEFNYYFCYYYDYRLVLFSVHSRQKLVILRLMDTRGFCLTFQRQTTFAFLLVKFFQHLGDALKGSIFLKNRQFIFQERFNKLIYGINTYHKIITKTYLYNFYPLKPHFYIVKLGFKGLYNIFLISAQKHRL